MENEQSQIKIRLPYALKEKITILAKKNKRTINAEVIASLELMIDAQNNSRVAITSTMDELIAKVSIIALNLANKQILIESLPASERELILTINKFKESKKETIIQSLLSLLNSNL